MTAVADLILSHIRFDALLAIFCSRLSQFAQFIRSRVQAVDPKNVGE